jgi:hypothetical protein
LLISKGTEVRETLKERASKHYAVIQEANPMQFKYRGVSYDYTPQTVDTQEAEVGGKFRGLDWRFRNLRKPAVIQPTADLTYRGVKYQVGGDTTQTEAAPTPSTQEKARVLMMNRHRAAQNRQQSMLTRSEHEVGLAHS